jgi:hypothetical protein
MSREVKSLEIKEIRAKREGLSLGTALRWIKLCDFASASFNDSNTLLVFADRSTKYRCATSESRGQTSADNLNVRDYAMNQLRCCDTDYPDSP